MCLLRIWYFFYIFAEININNKHIMKKTNNKSKIPTFKEFKDEIQLNIDNRPSYIRKGQAVFNFIDMTYGVARYVQFNKKVDCFYNDDAIDDFIKESYLALKSFS